MRKWRASTAVYTLPARVVPFALVEALVSWCPLVHLCGSAPDHLYTYSQLKRKGLTPRDRQERDGCIVTAFHQVVSLYDIREAQPRRGETAKQREARLAAWPHIQQKYTCARCGYMPASLAALRYAMHGPGLCLRVNFGTKLVVFVQ